MYNNVSLAVKHRPLEFEHVCSQEAIIKVFKQQIATGSIKNGYMLDGPSGCGKTTLGRILADKINKRKGSAIEFDAASNSSVEDVRAIIESSNTKSINGEYKVFIIDECHSLSSQAWQAFLKTLEEPNSKTVFIFCTTEIQKVPVTILNRVQRFDLTKIDDEKIFERLIYICKQENFIYEEEALRHIVKLSKGRMRDAISSLEKVASLNSEITLKSVLELLDTLDYSLMFSLVADIFDRNKEHALTIINDIDHKGKDLKLFINDFITFLLDINKYIILKDFKSISIPSSFEKELLYAINIENNNEFFLSILKEFINLKEQIRYETNVKTNLEITLLFLCK